MKRLITRLMVLAALVALALLAINSLYIRTGGYRNKLEFQGTNRFHEVPGGLEVVNFGSSHGAWAFDYETAGVNGFNFGLGAQDYYYDFQLAKRFADRLDDGCAVIIPVSFFSFGLNQRESRNTRYDYRYYGILPYGDIHGHNALDYLKYRWLPVLFEAERLEWLVRDETPREHGFKHREKNKFSERKLASVARSRAAYHKRLIDQPESVYDYNLANLAELISYCQEQGWRPVLVTTPYTSQYTSNFSSDFLDDFHERAEAVGKKYGVPYLDFSRSAPYSGDIELFCDSDHLNVRGRERFTGEVIDTLREMGML
jgi:hypothetical protein